MAYGLSTLSSSVYSGAAGTVVSFLALFLLATVADVTTTTISRSIPDAFEETLSLRLRDCGYVLTASRADTYLFQLKDKHKRCLPLDVLLVVDARHGASLHGPGHIVGVVAKRWDTVDLAELAE